jgi:putative ABC transport system permease protein
MRVRDHLKQVRHTFASNRARAALTLLGIVIGAGSIVLLAGLLRAGEEALLSTSQGATEADLIQVRADEPPAKQMLKTRRKLNQGDGELLADSPLLGGAPVATEAQKDTWATRPIRKRVRLVGARPVARELYRLEVVKGRFLTDEDIADRKHVCVVGHEVWRKLLEGRESIEGAVLVLEGQAWDVVGVLKDKPILGGGDGVWMWNRKVLIPQTTFDAHFAPAHDVQRLYVRLGGSGPLRERIRAVENVVKGTLLRRHYGVENFKVEGEESGVNQERLVLTIIKMLLLGTGLLSLFVGGINIMNIMLVTVTERTREIGVRRAIGAPPSAILTQFLMEAAFISLVGGVIGVLGGIGMLAFLSWALTRALGAWAFHVEPWSIALGLGLSLVTGIVFGWLPARRASRLDPVEALRYE